MKPNSPISADFAQIASRWRQDYEQQLILFVYHGYIAMCNSEDDPKDASIQERAITQDFYGYIHDQLNGMEPFRFLHSPSEFETQKTKKAKPPEYDMAFISREKYKAREKDKGIRLTWPLEAKKLNDTDDIKDYIATIQERFLTSKYAPFSTGGAMLGYLFSGAPHDVLQKLNKGLGTPVYDGFDIKPCEHGISDHTRKAHPKAMLPPSFTCHHIIIPFGEARTSS